MNKNAEFFNRTVDLITELVEFTAVARALKIGASTIHRWNRESRRDKKAGGPSEYLFERDGVTDYFHEHVKSVILNNIEDIESSARNRALYGTWAPSNYKGSSVFKRDPFLLANPDMVETLGLPNDLLLDDNGLPVPEMVWVPPSTDLVGMVLAAHSRKYRKQSKVDIDLNMRAAVSGGVMVVGGPAPKQVAAPLPLVEVLRDPIESVEAVDIRDAEPEDAAEPVDEPVEQPGESATKPEQAPPTPPQPGPNPAVRRGGMSELERDLLSRLNAAPGSAARAAPPASVFVRDADDYNPARSGAGPTPTGMKVV